MAPENEKDRECKAKRELLARRAFLKGAARSGLGVIGAGGVFLINNVARGALVDPSQPGGHGKSTEAACGCPECACSGEPCGTCASNCDGKCTCDCTCLCGCQCECQMSCWCECGSRCSGNCTCACNCPCNCACNCPDPGVSVGVRTPTTGAPFAAQTQVSSPGLNTPATNSLREQQSQSLSHTQADFSYEPETVKNDEGSKYQADPQIGPQNTQNLTNAVKAAESAVVNQQNYQADNVDQSDDTFTWYKNQQGGGSSLLSALLLD